MKKILPLIMLVIIAFTTMFTSVYAFDSNKWTLDNGYYYYNDITLERNDQFTKTHILTPQADQYIEYKKVDGTWVNTGYKNAKLILETQPGAAATRIWDVYLVSINEANQEISAPIYLVNATSQNQTFLSDYITFRFKEFTAPPVNEYDTVESLPNTTGNPFSETGTMGKVATHLDGYNLVLQITYGTQVRYLNYALALDTDLTPYQANNALYFTDSGSKYIAFSHDETKSMIKPTSSNTGYIPYTILNLTTMETKTFEMLSVYIHLKATEDTKKDLFGYFYMDQFVIDNLESATVIYNWRYETILNINSGWKNARVKVDAGETGQSESHWYTKYMTILMLGMPSLFNGEIFNDVTVDEIARVNWNQETLVTKDELDLRYSQENENFEGIKQSMDVYKLFLGSHNNPLATKIGIDASSVQVINIVYTKDNVVNTINAKDIDTSSSIDDWLIPQPDNPNIFDIINDLWHQYTWAFILAGVMIGFVVLALVVFPIITAVKNNTAALFSKPKRRRRR